MADWNRYRRRDAREEHERNGRRDRQPEQFQSDRACYGDDYDAYGQMGDDYSQARFGNQFDETGYQSDRYGTSWRDDRGARGRDRAPVHENHAGTGFGEARVSNSERGGFGSFNADGYRTAGSVGPREHQGYGRGESYARGAYSGGSYGAGTYGAAPRREYAGDREDRGDRGFMARAGDEIASWFGDEDAERRREIDHRGRGPANYTRSDERILEDACDTLTGDWGVDARNVQVTVQGGEVTLDGRVESRRQKRRAEDIVHDIAGVSHVQNNLRIEDIASRTEEETSASERNAGTLA